MDTFLILLVTGATILCGAFAQTDECRVMVGINGFDAVTLPVLAPCMLGRLQWNYPEGRLQLLFPRSVIPAESRRRCTRMRGCIRGDMELLTAVDSTGNAERPLVTVEDDEGSEWNCSVYRRNGALIGLEGPEIRERYANIIWYKIETMTRCRGGHGGRRRPRPGRPGRRGHRNRNNGNEADASDGDDVEDEDPDANPDDASTNDYGNMGGHGRRHGRRHRGGRRNKNRGNENGANSDGGGEDDGLDAPPGSENGGANNDGVPRRGHGRRNGPRRHGGRPEQRNGTMVEYDDEEHIPSVDEVDTNENEDQN